MTDEQTQEEREFLDEWERKRRRRRRTILLIVLGAVLLTVALPLLAGFVYDRYWQGRLNAKVAALTAQGKLLTLQQMLDRSKDLPADQNSALVYLSAFSQLEDEPQSDLSDMLGRRDDLGVRPSPQALDVLDAEAGANAQALETMLEAARLDLGSYPLTPGPVAIALTPDHLTPLRRCTRLCGRVAVLRAAQGRPDQATAYLLAQFGLASSLGRKTMLIEELVRIAADAIALDALERCVALCRFGPDDLKSLQTRAEREEAAFSRSEGILFERSVGHDSFRYAQENPKATGDLGVGFPLGLYRWVPGWRERDELFFHDIMDGMERAVALPPRQALLETKQMGATVMACEREMFPPPVLSAMLLPALTRAVRDEMEVRAHLLAAATALACERFRLKNGRWPDSLDQLVPEFLDDVPDDYFDVGKLHYVRTDRGVRVYSIGPDGQDNGGKTREEAHQAGLSEDGDIHDVVFRLLDPELRGAKTGTFREEVVGTGVSPSQLKAAGLDEDALKGAGLTDDDLEKLRGNQ